MSDLIKEKIWKLGFGYMRLPEKDGAIDAEQINKMADKFIESGGTYFDAAYTYEGAEAALRESVVKRHPRAKVQIATKMTLHPVEAPEHMEKQFRTSLERLGTDYIDFYLLHGINSRANEKIDKFGAWAYLSGLKAKGLIRHMGFSFHGPPEDLDQILTNHPEAEFCQLQINYMDWDSPKVNSRRLYEIARSHGVPVIIMEPLKGGMLTADTSPIAKLLRDANPEASMASWALRFAAQLDGVLVTLSGMSSLDQLSDNVGTFTDLRPLSKTEQDILDKAVAIFNGIPRIDCTACRYCVNDCPSKIMIPMMIDLYNDYLVHNTTANIGRVYGLMTRNGGKADDCTACRTCEKLCPQKLDIVDTLVKVSGLFS